MKIYRAYHYPTACEWFFLKRPTQKQILALWENNNLTAKEKKAILDDITIDYFHTED